MAETGPSKSDIESVFKRLRAVSTNKVSNLKIFKDINKKMAYAMNS